MIKIKKLNKYFSDKHILKDINIEVRKGQKVSIIGPSGSGKSTLIRCINLLEIPESGEIYINGTNILNEKNISNIRKNIAMVFQNFNLFNNKNVLNNIILAPILLGLKTQKEAEKNAYELLDKVGLLDKINSYPSQLSGGQKQRVAIARAMAMNPEIILFDEPTSALDPEMVQEVLNVIRDLSKDDITMLIVTHEMNFAKNISDEIWFMDEGKIIEKGSPDILFNNPKNKRTLAFLNKINLK
ncbi:amino acid ABC transporter ATP-binding protein [Oceanotoga sp. DSM 15011]|uniref:amino acid ABC transporter ATP-binding protein n=1 Tax=Oceanotoga sp. DSM 15011 TaxID=2984951 RepID=UPI0021F3E2E2|nr:amino acid ABC transporter ATP-binding protein [Oceanotoga sp. DSM 15011]UYP00378.1 amino acid ABC transporter ATP-binding protein [Oceanotoga sp. DSM 15011]